MKRPILSLPRSAVLGALLLVAGCGTSPREEAVTFHAAINDATQLVERADLDFMVSLLPVVRGEKYDVAQVHAAFDAVKQAVAESRAKVAAATAPDTNTARALIEVHRKFVERHEKALANEFDAAVKVTDAKDMPQATRSGQVRDLFVRLQDAEYDDFAALHKAQTEFAKEHHLVVREERQDQALSFLTGLGVANGRLEMGGKELGNALRPALGEQRVVGDRVARTLQDARDTLAAVRRIVDALRVPPGKAGHELAAAQKDYLKRQGEIFDQYFPELIKLAHDPVLVPETRRERLDEVMKLMQVAEQAPLLRLQAAREEFLREHRLIRK